MGTILRRIRASLSSVAKLALPAVLVAGFMGASTTGASAVTTNCTSAEQTWVAIASQPLSCVPALTLPSNINGNAADPFLARFPEYKTLSKTDSPNAFLNDSAVWVTKPVGPGTALAPGSFELAASLLSSYHSLVIAFKQGNGWVAFFLPDFTLEGEWWTSTGGLSHAMVYGIAGAATVPVPAGIALGASGLGLLGLLGWRRRKGAT